MQYLNIQYILSDKLPLVSLEFEAMLGEIDVSPKDYNDWMAADYKCHHKILETL